MTLRQGVIAAQARDFDRARQLLQQVTTAAPDDPVAWYWLAIASQSADAAIPCLQRVLALDPSHPKARQALARLLVTRARAATLSGDRVEARVHAAAAAEILPGDPAPWLLLATIAADQVDRISALRQASNLLPEDARLRTQLRQALLARGVMISNADPAEARARFREAADINPLDARVWTALATMSESRAEKLHALRELIRVAPDHRRGRVALRNVLVVEAEECASAGQIGEACERWREAIAVNGGDVESWLGLAAVTPDEEEAARAIETAYEMDPLDERAAAALDRLRGPQIDPTTAAVGDDMFDRFEPAEDVPLELPDSEVDLGDSLLDAFAKLAGEVSASTAKAPDVSPAAPAAEPAAAVMEPAAPAALAPVETPAAAEPAVAPVHVEPAAVPAVPAAAVSEPPAGRRTVLVVDDSPTIRKILGLTLEKAGYAVVAEPDGESALARLAQQIPHVILLDIAMPGLDGYEVCRRIKQEPRTEHVPVIMLSGKGAFFDKVKGRMAGATEYLTKPFETPAVLAAVAAQCATAVEVHHG